MYQTRYRMLDPALGRWWQVDPLADQLVWQTPYNSMDNNPIRYNDPEGDCPSCAWGAVIGGGTEYLSQVAGNVIASGEGYDALLDVSTYTNVDLYDIGVSTLTGAATGGLSALNAAKSTIKIVSISAEVTKATIDVKSTEEGVKIQTVIDDKSVTEATIDLVSGSVAATVDGSITKEVVESAPAIQKVAAETVESFTETLSTVPREPTKQVFENEQE